MTDLPPYSNSNDDPGVGPGRGSTVGSQSVVTSAPLWVKVFGIIAIVLVLLFVILLFTGGEHGPRRHFPPEVNSGNTTSEEDGGHRPPTEHGAQQP